MSRRAIEDGARVNILLTDRHHQYVKRAGGHGKLSRFLRATIDCLWTRGHLAPLAREGGEAAMRAYLLKVIGATDGKSKTSRRRPGKRQKAA